MNNVHSPLEDQKAIIVAEPMIGSTRVQAMM